MLSCKSYVEEYFEFIRDSGQKYAAFDICVRNVSKRLLTEYIRNGLFFDTVEK